MVGMTASGKTSLKDKTLKSDSVKYYAVAITKDGAYKSANGAAKKLKLGASAKIKKVSSTSKGIRITWKKANKASKYVIYRSMKKNSGYTRIKTVGKKTLSYVDKKAKKGKKYYYRIAVERSGQSSLMGKASKRMKR